jgi:quercetin dioxygenase-like cupin family protein
VILAVAVLASGRSSTSGGFVELHRAPIGGSDLEVVMGILERSGGAVSTKHHHPGGEFGFLLEGSATIESEDAPHTLLRAGDSFHQPAGKWHVVKVAPEGARTLVFRVLRKGEPTIVEVD